MTDSDNIFILRRLRRLSDSSRRGDLDTLPTVNGRRFSLIARLVMVALTVMLASCSNDAPKAGNPAVTTEADPYAVPAVINAEYLNRVMAKLAEIKVVAVRDTVNSGTLTPDAQRRLEAIYSGPALESQLRQARGPLPTDLPTIDETTPPDQFTVTEIKQATPTCVWFDADYVAGLDGTTGGNTIVLRRFPHDPLNPTPWMQQISRLQGPLSSDEDCE